MSSLLEALRQLAAADGAVDRTPRTLGEESQVESEPHAGVVHGARHLVLLDPLVLALPLPRTLALAAAGSGLVEVVLPAESPENLRRLLVDGAGLTLDAATTVVDLTVDVLEQHLGIRADPHAGLAEGGHALAQFDLAVADALADGRGGLAEAVRLVLATHDDVDGPGTLAQWLGRLGLNETAAAVAAVDA